MAATTKKPPAKPKRPLSQTDPRSPDYDPQAAKLKAEEQGRRSGAYEERRKQAAKRKETVATEKEKSRRRGAGEARTQARQEQRETLADPLGPVARQARKSYSAGQADVVAYFKELANQATWRATVDDAIANAPTTEDLDITDQINDMMGQTDTRGQRYTIGAPQSVGTVTPAFSTISRENGARIIMVMTGVSALGIAIRWRNTSDHFTLPTGDRVVVSASLRQYGALVVVAIIALVVNEFSPPIAVGLMAILFIDIMVNSGIFDFLQTVMSNRDLVTLHGGGGIASTALAIGAVVLSTTGTGAQPSDAETRKALDGLGLKNIATSDGHWVLTKPGDPNYNAGLGPMWLFILDKNP